MGIWKERLFTSIPLRRARERWWPWPRRRHRTRCRLHWRRDAPSWSSASRRPPWPGGSCVRRCWPRSRRRTPPSRNWGRRGPRPRAASSCSRRTAFCQDSKFLRLRNQGLFQCFYVSVFRLKWIRSAVKQMLNTVPEIKKIADEASDVEK